MKIVFKTLNNALSRYTPDPFVIAMLISLSVFTASLLFTKLTLMETAEMWGESFWALIPFTLQMIMVLLGGFILATSTPVQRILNFIALKIKSPNQAIVICTTVSCVSNLINWGFGLIVSAFLCRSLIGRVKNLNYSLLVASSYSGFLLWHGGLSGSIPLIVSTEGNFSQQFTEKIIPISDTVFSSTNIIAVVSLMLILPILNLKMNKNSQIIQEEFKIKEENEKQIEKILKKTPAERLETSFFVSFSIVVIGVVYIIQKMLKKEFTFDLNQTNLILIIFGLLFHKNPRNFLNAADMAADKIWPILIQYPFYAGIMGIITHSGIAHEISNFFIAISNKDTFPLFTFYSAGVINLFIPSGGGQWAVQAPIVIHGAKAIGANLEKSIMAVAWGDAWTNMAQPFWAIPLLSIAGLKISEIIGYCFMILISS